MALELEEIIYLPNQIIINGKEKDEQSLYII